MMDAMQSCLGSSTCMTCTPHLRCAIDVLHEPLDSHASIIKRSERLAQVDVDAFQLESATIQC